jgi:putative NADH-flavin reductase
MKLTIFGATGRTGRLLVEQALNAGHEATVLVRDASKLSVQNDKLSVITGQIDDPDKVAEAICDTEAVLSALGPVHNRPTFEISAGMENIIAAMKKNGPRRLIISIGAGVGDPNVSPSIQDHLITFVLKSTARYGYEDMFRAAEKVRASDLDWTIVRAPMLTDEPLRGKIRANASGQRFGPRLGRADLAQFMLMQLGDESFIRKAPVIGY